jgi:hypothetical protein
VDPLEFKGPMEEEIARLIEAKGPLTGSEIKEFIGGDHLLLWQTCKASKNLLVRSIGIKYLRLDQRVSGFARISPSILREFLTYSVVGLTCSPKLVEQRSQEILSHIIQVSRSKLELARNFVHIVQTQFGDTWPLEQVCFILAGDIVFDMAHDVPRPERSTGKLVRGSDIDLVVVLDDRAPDDFTRRLDRAIYQEKYRTLISPAFNEEIDYVVKKMERVREQVRFDTFKKMIACKIIQEGMLIGGSVKLYRETMKLLIENGVLEKLDELHKAAVAYRKQEEIFLIQSDAAKINREDLYFFYPSEESEEFE